MNKVFYLLLSLFSTNLLSQVNSEIRIPTLNEVAPKFTAHSTQGTINYPDDFFDKWRIILSHPADFTPVCTSEIWELAQMQNDFEDLNTKLMVISTDGLNSHLQWIESLESLEYKGKKPVKIKFPLISDVNMAISNKFGMQHPYINSTLNVRGVFIISPDNHIQFIAFYPSNVGRNISELKRVLIALQKTFKKDLLTPVNWQLGDDCMITPPKTIAESEKLKSKNDPNYYSYNWYMWFKKDN